MTQADGTPDLETLAALAREAGSTSLAEEAEALAERLTEGRFYVVCVGQFKRGKSTLLNALIGASVLPTGVVPITAAVTVIRYGDPLGARVRFRDRDWEDCDPRSLATYVSDEHNPGNEKGVTGVEVFAPSPLLGAGMCLVDTPGLGSVSLANTEATRQFVPHVDAALVVVGADPPITGEELALVQEVARAVRDVIVVLNKADHQSDAERAEASRFTERVLRERLGRPVPGTLQVSALERLERRGSGRDWDTLVGRLESLARDSGAELIEVAQARETQALVERLARELDEQRSALLRPISESEARVRLLRAAISEAERSLADLGHLLAAEQERLSRRFTEERDRFFGRALPAAMQELREVIQAGARAGRPLRERALEHGRDVMKRWLEHWRQEQEPQAESLYREAETRFVELANSFQGRLAAVPGLEALPRLTAHPGFRAKGHLYYTEMLSIAPASGARWIRDLIPWRRAQAIERDATRYLERLLEVNSARIKNDFDDRVVRSRRQLESEVRERLRGLSAAAERALEGAREAQAAGSAAVEARASWLEALRRRVEALRRPLAAQGAPGRGTEGRTPQDEPGSVFA